MLKGPLQPTLWRTCRVLANRQRLQILDLLVRDSDELSVDAVARKLKLTPPVASLELRRLQSRGFLQCRRRGRHVWYRFAADKTLADAVRLAPAIRAGLTKNSAIFIDECYRLCTGFTHPRRIEILKALSPSPLTRDDLLARTGITGPALSRHLAKLVRRKLIQKNGGRYRVQRQPTPLGRRLISLVQYRNRR